MKVTQEIVTVLPDPLAGEINIVIAGYRIALTADESALLVHGLATSLERLVGGSAAQPAEVWSVRRDQPENGASDTSVDAAEAMQQRTRALIRATMRAKGLSLGEENSE
jgi:hypothetical protein